MSVPPDPEEIITRPLNARWTHSNCGAVSTAPVDATLRNASNLPTSPTAWIYGSTDKRSGMKAYCMEEFHALEPQIGSGDSSRKRKGCGTCISWRKLEDGVLCTSVRRRIVNR